MSIGALLPVVAASLGAREHLHEFQGPQVDFLELNQQAGPLSNTSSKATLLKDACEAVENNLHK